MENKRRGKRTLLFPGAPWVRAAASIVSSKEGDGPIGRLFDVVLEDDTWGEDSFERAECRMFEEAVRLALKKCGMQPEELGCLLGGDLLNQIITANYAARSLKTPFLGLYGACSTMAESLLLGSVLVDGGFAESAACVASSHFSTAERQYRFPLEMGTTAPETAQRTVTGAGCVVLCRENADGAQFGHVRVRAATIGRVVDLGITDANNMGAAMAPAACDTIVTHLKDLARTVEDYDRIVTGDLGHFGSEMLLSLCRERGVELAGRHLDCGCRIYAPEQDVKCGGSGCGCSAVTLAAELLDGLERGEWRRMLFLATGALLSPTATLQGESIPGIAHAVVLEWTDGRTW